MSSPEEQQQQEFNEWIRFAMKLAVQSALHPFEYSKVLIQVSVIDYIHLPNHNPLTFAQILDWL